MSPLVVLESSCSQPASADCIPTAAGGRRSAGSGLHPLTHDFPVKLSEFSLRKTVGSQSELSILIILSSRAFQSLLETDLPASSEAGVPPSPSGLEYIPARAGWSASLFRRFRAQRGGGRAALVPSSSKGTQSPVTPIPQTFSTYSILPLAWSQEPVTCRSSNRRRQR